MTIVEYRYAMPAVASALSVRLLGPLEVAVGGRPVVVDTRKALAIVALLASEGRPFARDELAAMFWPEADDDAARGALRRTLSALRTAVIDPGLRVERGRVVLEPAVDVDLVELERLARSSDLADLEAATALARGPFLAGFTVRDSPAFDDWQAARAARVERTVGDLLDRLATARSGVGDAGGAVDAARRRVEVDPLDELGQRRLIELLARSGDRAGAIAQYRSLVALFDRELGVAPLRGTTELYDAVREDRLRPAPKPSSAPMPVAHAAAAGFPLVARDREVAALLAAWRAAAASGRIALVEGEPGIGKTRLAEAVAAMIRDQGGVVLAGRGYPGEAAIAYGPIAELIRAGLARPGGLDRLALLDEAVRLEIGRVIDLPPSLRVAAPASPDGPSARMRLLEAIARTLSALVAGPVPGLIWIDDLHLADASSREAVAYLARRLTDRPMLLLLAWRREDLPPDGLAVATALAALPGVTALALERLDRAGVAAMVRAVRRSDAGGDPVDTAEADLIDGLLAHSEGLPLHVVEALAGDDPLAATLPGGVQAILRDRIASVGETAGQVLSAAAVIGRSFDLDTVRRASGRTDEETIDALDELTRRGIVRELPESTDVAGTVIRYDFSHGALRDAAYGSMSLARRRLLHRRTADALRLDAAGVGRDDVARAALIGVHEREAGRPAEAALAYREAARRAEAVYANREAIDHLTSFLALGGGSVADGGEAAEAHVRIGELSARLGEYPTAVAALETAAALASPDALPAVEVALGRIQRRRGDLAAADSHLLSALASPAITDPVRARAEVERSLVALRTGDLELADQTARAAVATAAAADDRHDTGIAERLVGLVAQARGDGTAARLALERSASLAADDPDPTAWIAASTALALTLAADGSVDAGIAAATAAIDACRRIGDRHLEAAVENHLADICHAAGRPDELMLHLKRAVALFAEIGEAMPEPEPGIWALAAW